jgi:CubicO group peptidase (beta-lactamase class C family)
MALKTGPKNLKEYIESYLPTAFDEYQIPGAGVAVVKDNQILFQGGVGYRDHEKKIPVDSHTLFASGSTGKAFTATILGQLVDEGKLSWNDPVIKYVPEFRTKDPVANVQLTIRDIQCHRSGLPRHDLAWLFSDASRQELLEKIQFLEPFAPIRSAFYYNNFMWTLAGIVGERITGKTWEENVKERIFIPLGMNDVNCSVEDTQKTKNFSYPYQIVSGKIERVPFHNINSLGPAGAINSHIEDYTKWLMMNLNKGQNAGRQIISAASLGEIHAPQMVMNLDNELAQRFAGYKEFSNPNYTLGWFYAHYRGTRMLMHSGGIDGFSAFIAFLPDEGVGAIVLTNLGGTITEYGITWELIDRALGWEPIDWAKRCNNFDQRKNDEAEEGLSLLKKSQVKNTISSHPLNDFVGEYFDPGYGLVSIQIKEGSLKGKFNNLEFDLIHFHHDIFLLQSHSKVMDLDLPVSFITGFDGKIQKVLIPFEPMTTPIEFIHKI